MLARTLDLLHVARNASPRHGVLAFNVIGLEHAAAIVEGAELERSPAILQISQNTVRHWGGAIGPLASACRELATGASVPIAIHLDHATEEDLCDAAVRSGVSSVMFDASAESWEENVRQTACMATWAHARGIGIEGEIGIVGGKDGVRTTADGFTDPDEAAAFVAATGVDALAVAVGTEHGMVEQVAALDLDRISALFAAVDVPLVLHGSSGVPAEVLREAVQRGITKVNVATQLNVAYTRTVRAVLAGDPTLTDPRKYTTPARAAIVDVVRGACRLVGSSGMAH
jgi:fructose-bisphosphate aldolase, class II